MNVSSYADKIDAFQTTIDNLEPDVAKYPGTPPTLGAGRRLYRLRQSGSRDLRDQPAFSPPSPARKRVPDQRVRPAPRGGGVEAEDIEAAGAVPGVGGEVEAGRPG